MLKRKRTRSNFVIYEDPDADTLQSEDKENASSISRVDKLAYIENNRLALILQDRLDAGHRHTPREVQRLLDIQSFVQFIGPKVCQVKQRIIDGFCGFHEKASQNARLRGTVYTSLENGTLS